MKEYKTLFFELTKGLPEIEAKINSFARDGWKVISVIRLPTPSTKLGYLGQTINSLLYHLEREKPE